MKTFLTLSLSLFMLACGGSSKKDATTPTPVVTETTESTETTEPATAETTPTTDGDPIARAKELLTGMTDAFRSADGDCKVIAANVRAWNKANPGAMAELNAMESSLTPEQQQRAEAELQPIFEEMMGVMRPAADACQDDADFQAAMQEMSM